MMTRRAFLAAAGAGALVRTGRSASRYDLVIKGGRVIDPAAGLDRAADVADVAIQGGRIRAVSPDIAGSEAAEVLDARGALVTPGLLDLHVHVAAPELPPSVLLGDGVTAMVDAGSAGADNIDALVRVAEQAPNRVRIFLNIARSGVTPEGELLNIAAADVDAARRAVAAYPAWIAGIKVRLSLNVAGDHDLEALRRARQAAGPLPVMLHVGQTFSPLARILELLTPGDIVTHPYSPPPHGILDDNGHVIREVRDARRRGIRFDVGNGRNAHITWEIVEAATREGFWPDTISSDITAPGRTFRVFDLPTIVAKFLLLGMPLERAVACVTANAAKSVAAFRNLGTLRPGAPADVALFDVREGEFQLVDNADVARIGRRKLVPRAVVIGGRQIHAA
jgi:dihydroorotase